MLQYIVCWKCVFGDGYLAQLLNTLITHLVLLTELQQSFEHRFSVRCIRNTIALCGNYV